MIGSLECTGRNQTLQEQCFHCGYLEKNTKQFQIEQQSFNDFIIKLVIDEEEQDMLDVDSHRELFVRGIYGEELKKCNYSFWIEDEMFPEEVEYDEDVNVKGGKFKYFKKKFKII